MDTKGLRRLPEHMSVILSLRKEHDALERLMDQVADLAAWSARTGIPTLSVYEKNGLYMFDLVKSDMYTDRNRKAS